jgi:hypothetical protein
VLLHRLDQRDVWIPDGSVQIRHAAANAAANCARIVVDAKPRERQPGFASWLPDAAPTEAIIAGV